MLSNAYFLANFRFDTAENEPAKNLQNFRKMHFSRKHFRKMHFRRRRPNIGALLQGPGRRPRDGGRHGAGRQGAAGAARLRRDHLSVVRCAADEFRVYQFWGNLAKLAEHSAALKSELSGKCDAKVRKSCRSRQMLQNQRRKSVFACKNRLHHIRERARGRTPYNIGLLPSLPALSRPSTV